MIWYCLIVGESFYVHMKHLGEVAKCNKKLDKNELMSDIVKNAQKTMNKLVIKKQIILQAVSGFHL